MAPKVIILGGGVAGMSAAHELIERGFPVQVYEAKASIPGGKARSVPVPDSATDGHKPLPGEHGFRFFPGFYRHVTDTMKRIPFPGNDDGVLDNLVPSTKVMMARFGQKPVVTLTRFPHSMKDLHVLMSAVTDAHTGLTDKEKMFFAARTWQLMTSSWERRVNDYERLGWWQYMQADRFSEAYRSLFVKGLTRTLVAAKAKEASTKTGGDIFIQLLFNMANPRIAADRVLNGPTNDVWIDPWLAYLKEQGVQYTFGARATAIHCKKGRITGVAITHDDGRTEEVKGDYYIAAVPVEQMAPLLNTNILKADPVLQGICKLAPDVAWMTGIQYYLNEKVVINQGHVIYSDTPWALTSISQLQFWDGFKIEQYGDGTVRTVLSVDISDWDTAGLLYGKAARDCTKEEIKDEVWAQLKKSLADDPLLDLDDDMIVDWYLDRDIDFDDAKPVIPHYGDGCPPETRPTSDFKTQNKEPLLVNKVNTWALRPEAVTNIPNLFLAADYVRTNTDLATMEGANEAARRAVNGIIEASGRGHPFCKIWNLHEPWVLVPLRWLDRRRYRKGLPWKNEFPWLFKLLHSVMALLHRIVAKRPKAPSHTSK